MELTSRGPQKESGDCVPCHLKRGSYWDMLRSGVMNLGRLHLAGKVLVLRSAWSTKVRSSVLGNAEMVDPPRGCSLGTYPGLVDVSWWAMLHILVWEVAGGPLLWCHGVESPVVAPMRYAWCDISD